MKNSIGEELGQVKCKAFSAGELVGFLEVLARDGGSGSGGSRGGGGTGRGRGGRKEGDC